MFTYASRTRTFPSRYNISSSFAMQSKGLKVDEFSLQTFAMYSRPLFRDASYLESPEIWKTLAI